MSYMDIRECVSAQTLCLACHTGRYGCCLDPLHLVRKTFIAVLCGDMLLLFTVFYDCNFIARTTIL